MVVFNSYGVVVGNGAGANGGISSVGHGVVDGGSEC